MINLNFQSDDNQTNDFLFVCEKFNQRPSRFVLHDSFDGLGFTNLLNQVKSSTNVDNIFIEYINAGDEYIKNQRVLYKLSENCYISYLEIDKDTEDYIVSEIVFYFKNPIDISEVESFVEKIKELSIEIEFEAQSQLNYLSIRESNLVLDPINCGEKTFENIENFYNEDTFNKTKKFIKKLKKNDSGISILFGEDGVGKSSLSKYIANQIDKITVYIPINLIDHTINNPEFKNFLKKYGKVLLIIDDCEFLINPLFSKSNFFLYNLIQITDVIFSEICNVHTLLIFNCRSIDQIDNVLLESNSLIDILQIDYLNQDTANELSNHLGIKKSFKQSVKLIDIFKNKKTSKDFKIGLQ